MKIDPRDIYDCDKHLTISHTIKPTHVQHCLELCTTSGHEKWEIFPSYFHQKSKQRRDSDISF